MNTRLQMLFEKHNLSDKNRYEINQIFLLLPVEKQKNILICFSGHGHFDMAAYDNYLSDNLKDVEFSDNLIKEALKDLPNIKVN